MPACLLSLSWQWPASCLFLSRYFCMCEHTKSTQSPGDTGHISVVAFSLYLPSLSSTVFHVSDKKSWSKPNHRLLKRWMGVNAFMYLVWSNYTWKGQIAPPTPPSLILYWDSLTPVIDMLLKYSSRLVTLTFLFWAHKAPPLWARILVWICGFVGGSWDFKVTLWSFFPSYNLIYARYSISAGLCAVAFTD